MTRYQTAIFAVAASSLINSAGGVLIRHVEVASVWQIVSLRGGALAVGLCVVFCVQCRGRVLSGFWQAGPWALLGAFFQTFSGICYIHSLQTTTVANTLFVMSSTPLATAVLARIFLGETASRSTWIAMLFASFGIAVMFADGFGSGSGFGNTMALLSMLGFAAFVVVLRRGRAVNMLPAVILGGVL